MGKCDVCGNDYDKSFKIDKDGVNYTFDCFECAIKSLAPECQLCGVKIIGHGVEHDGVMFCCAHCARASLLEEAEAACDRV